MNWENIKHTNIRIVEVPEEELKGPEEKKNEEIIAENFPNTGKKTPIQVEEAENPIQDKPKEKQWDSY